MVALDNVHAEDKIIIKNVVAAIEALKPEKILLSWTVDAVMGAYVVNAFINDARSGESHLDRTNGHRTPDHHWLLDLASRKRHHLQRPDVVHGAYLHDHLARWRSGATGCSCIWSGLGGAGVRCCFSDTTRSITCANFTCAELGPDGQLTHSDVVTTNGRAAWINYWLYLCLRSKHGLHDNWYVLTQRHRRGDELLGEQHLARRRM